MIHMTPEQKLALFETIDMVITAAIESGKPLRFMVAAILIMKLSPKSKTDFANCMVDIAHQEQIEIQSYQSSAN